MAYDLKEEYYDINFKERKECPWCKWEGHSTQYGLEGGGYARKCTRCGCVYSSVTVAKESEAQYWEKWESKVHNADQDLKEKRKVMYHLDFDVIKPFLADGMKVLDVGCADGSFLNIFSSAGYSCAGVEFAKEAYDLASSEYEIYYGEFPDLNIPSLYDVIIFRGVIQLLERPKAYFDKAISLLNDNGLIYITASPNADCLVHELYKQTWRLSVTASAHTLYNEKILTDYFSEHGLELILSKQMYLNTPYENKEEDIKKVAEAINSRARGEEPKGEAPAFYDNLLTLLYRKRRD